MSQENGPFHVMSWLDALALEEALSSGSVWIPMSQLATFHWAQSSEHFHNKGTDDQSKEDDSQYHSFQHVMANFALRSENRSPIKTLQMNLQ